MNLTLDIKDNMVFLAIFTALLSAVVATANKKIPELLWFLASFVIAKREILDSGDASFVVRYLQREVSDKKRAAGATIYTSQSYFVRPLREIRNVWFRFVAAKTSIFWHHGSPILFLPAKEWNKATSINGTPSVREYSKVFFLKGTVDWPALLAAADQYEVQRVAKRTDFGGNYRVVRYFLTDDKVDGKLEESANGRATFHNHLDPVHWEESELGPERLGSGVDDLSLTPELEGVVRRAKDWYASREWYAEHMMAWRTGLGFVGRPGTGKTSLIRGLGIELDLPVFIIDMSRATNAQFAKMWEDARTASGSGKRIVVLEDIDTVFNLREPANDSVKMTFEALLNTIDGVKREDGLILIVTSNHPERIDPALGVMDAEGRSTRPGRIDEVVVFPDTLDLKGRVKLADRILDGCSTAEVVAAGESDTPAQFSARCVTEALRRRRMSGRMAA